MFLQNPALPIQLEAFSRPLPAKGFAESHNVFAAVKQSLQTFAYLLNIVLNAYIYECLSTYSFYVC